MNESELLDVGAVKPQTHYNHQLSSPLPFLWTMLLFLIIVGFLVAILFRQAYVAFMSNPGLNGFILGVLLIGILLVFLQVFSLRPEVRWFNAFQAAGSVDKVGRLPKLLAPMRAMVNRGGAVRFSAVTQRSVLDSIATRLDETRDTSRYLIGLLVFLGLLGTFWGLIGTIGSISTVIQSLDPSSGDATNVLGSLKSGLTAPLAGMGTAFSSSLLGLAGSLILGFLDLQAGRAQNRFYTELENWTASVTDTSLDGTGDGKRAVAGSVSNERSLAAMAGLAEGIQGLVKNMRGEQQMLRDWIEAQQEESKALRRALDRLSAHIDGEKANQNNGAQSSGYQREGE
jgi:hypothetical protein